MTRRQTSLEKTVQFSEPFGCGVESAQKPVLSLGSCIHSTSIARGLPREYSLRVGNALFGLTLCFVLL